MDSDKLCITGSILIYRLYDVAWDIDLNKVEENAQLLELRVYDDMLDRELDIINERMITQVPPAIWKIKRYEELAAKVMRTVMDVTSITEKIDNSIKVTESVEPTTRYRARLQTSPAFLCSSARTVFPQRLP